MSAGALWRPARDLGAENAHRGVQPVRIARADRGIRLVEARDPPVSGLVLDLAIEERHRCLGFPSLLEESHSPDGGVSPHLPSAEGSLRHLARLAHPLRPFVPARSPLSGRRLPQLHQQPLQVRLHITQPLPRLTPLLIREPPHLPQRPHQRIRVTRQSPGISEQRRMSLPTSSRWSRRHGQRGPVVHNRWWCRRG